MKTTPQSQQLENDLISNNNTINSLNERIAQKNDTIDAINRPGRPDAVMLEYGDRKITLPIEEPNKYAAQMEDFLIKLIQADVDSLKVAGKKQQEEKKKTEKQLADLKANG